MSVAQIYDFNGLVEPAVKKLLVEQHDLKCATTYDSPLFQKDRPRVDLIYIHGAGLGRWAVVINGVNAASDPTVVAGLTPRELFRMRRESAWTFTLKFDIITDADMAIHSDYRATVRNALSQVWWKMMDPGFLDRHSIQLQRDTGDAEIKVSADKQFYKTEIAFEGSISVQGNAWAALVET